MFWEVWNICNAKLGQDSMTVRNLIKQSGVTLICTTDDPIDSLEYHKQIADDTTFDVQVLPAWRPDKAMNIEKPDYLDYLAKLSDVSKIKVDNNIEIIYKYDSISQRHYFEDSTGKEIWLPTQNCT